MNIYKKFLTLTMLTSFSSIVAATTIDVWKSPTCGCCTKWVTHLEKNGFDVISHNTNKMSLIKDKHNIPKKLRSCHTATVNGHVIEGHVPAEDIKRLLEIKSKTISIIGVPGMPAGSPGMEMGNRFDPYPVIAISNNGSPSLFSYHKK